MPAPTSLRDKLDKFSIPEPNTGCHLWFGATTDKGYGLIKHRGENIPAHRVAYRLANGEIPDGMVVMHGCDVTWCVNPMHLSLGTNTDNMRDSRNKGRHWNGRKTHCKHGHAFDARNTYVTSCGYRACIACKNWRSKGYAERAKV